MPLNCSAFESAKEAVDRVFKDHSKKVRKESGMKLFGVVNTVGQQRVVASICHGLLIDIFKALKHYGYDPSLDNANCELLKHVYLK